jgi:histidinol phosphatase-like PHP family hydrolase
MRITSDWHIHSHNSCDEASLALSDLAREIPATGVLDYGVTDHLNVPYNLADLEASRREFDANLGSPRAHFGVEVSVVSQWELDELAQGGHEAPVWGLRAGGPPGAEPALALSEANLETLGIEYVIGGVHWPLYAPVEREAMIRDYHRQYMFLAAHPLVTIVAHPWWWNGPWKDEDGVYRSAPWFDDFGHVPQSMHDEFAGAVKTHGKVMEFNPTGLLLNKAYPAAFKQQYLEYLAGMHAAGVTMSLGMDCHSAHYDVDLTAAEELLTAAGIRDDQLWRLPPRQGGA